MLCKEEKSSPPIGNTTCEVPISTKRRIQGGRSSNLYGPVSRLATAPFAIIAKALTLATSPAGQDPGRAKAPPGKATVTLCRAQESTRFCGEKPGALPRPHGQACRRRPHTHRRRVDRRQPLCRS